MIFLIIPACFAALFLLFVCLVMTRRKKRDDMRPFKQRLIAHRGLFAEECPENSLAAFERAMRSGFGIELDVRTTCDGRLVVFHDETLMRMCGDKRRVSDLTYEELSSFRLLGTDERIPLFEDVLRLIDGAVPMIIEIKPQGGRIGTCKKTASMLDGYGGDFCIESFDPSVLRWFKKNRPSFIRGQLAQNFFKSGGRMALPVRFFMTYLLVDFIGRPDFIAFNHNNKKTLAMRFLKRTHSASFAAWTVRSEEELAAASEFYDIMIFDGFMPKI